MAKMRKEVVALPVVVVSVGTIMEVPALGTPLVPNCIDNIVTTKID